MQIKPLKKATPESILQPLLSIERKPFPAKNQTEILQSVLFISPAR